MIQATSGEGKRVLDPPTKKYGCSATEKWEEKNGKTNGGQNRRKKKIMAEIVATMSLPVNYLTATDCNAAAHANITLNATTPHFLIQSLSHRKRYLAFKHCLERKGKKIHHGRGL